MSKLLSSIFVEPVKLFVDNKDLIFYMVKAELKSKHFRKLLGPLWWLFEPLSMALVYFFLTTILFKSSTGPHQFLFILVAVISWRWFVRTIDDSPSLLHSYASIISRTNFPLLPLIYINAIVQLIYFLAGLVIIFAFLPIYGIPITANVLYLPLIMIVEGMFILGLGSLLARAGVHMRDLGSSVWVFTSIWFYLSPAIYPASLVPQNWRFLYDLNPWGIIFSSYRGVLIDGNQPDFFKLLIWAGIFFVMMVVGLKVVSRNRGRIFKEL